MGLLGIVGVNGLVEVSVEDARSVSLAAGQLLGFRGAMIDFTHFGFAFLLIVE